eukprot:CFRG3123T1
MSYNPPHGSYAPPGSYPPPPGQPQQGQPHAQQYPPPPMNYRPSSQYPPPLGGQYAPSVPNQYPPPPSGQHSKPAATQYPPPLQEQHVPPRTNQYPPPPIAQQIPSLPSQHLHAPQSNQYPPAPQLNQYPPAPQSNQYPTAPQSNQYPPAPQSNQYPPAPQSNQYPPPSDTFQPSPAGQPVPGHYEGQYPPSRPAPHSSNQSAQAPPQQQRYPVTSPGGHVPSPSLPYGHQPPPHPSLQQPLAYHQAPYYGHGRPGQATLPTAHGIVNAEKLGVPPLSGRRRAVLVDDQQNSSFHPTRRNILNALGWLSGEAKPGDSLFFHYSGHGGQVRDTNGDEEDGMDETIIPMDYKQAGQIVDDELHMNICKKIPKGCRLTSVMDCCHSGTGLDLPYRYTLTRSGVKQTVDNIGVKRGKETRGEVVLFSGCQDNQTSADTSALSGGTRTGAMTFSFIQAVETHYPNLSYEKLLIEMSRVLRKHRMSQEPSFSTGHVMDGRMKFEV